MPQDFFVTSDTHFWQKKALQFFPFRAFLWNSIEDMNEGLIEEWNSAVSKGDLVYHLGDFSFGDARQTVEIIKRLNGTIHLIRGNHDKVMFHGDVRKLLADVKERLGVSVHDPEAFQGLRYMQFDHYAPRCWNRSHYESWSVHGHSHGDLPQHPRIPSIDCGIDAHFKRIGHHRPMSFEEIKIEMKDRDWEGVRDEPPDYRSLYAEINAFNYDEEDEEEYIVL